MVAAAIATAITPANDAVSTAGSVVVTSNNKPLCDPGRPWQIDLFIQFTDEVRALKFERYLKSGSGCAFAMSNR